jgi:hypothetical protein
MEFIIKLVKQISSMYCQWQCETQYLVVSNIFMEQFEETALEAAGYKAAQWLIYINDTFLVWPHGLARLQQFVHHLNIVRPTIKFTIEIEDNDTP